MSPAGRQHSLRRMMAWIAIVAVGLAAFRFVVRHPEAFAFVLQGVVPPVALVWFFAKVVIPVGLMIRSELDWRPRPWPAAAVIGLFYWATVVFMGMLCFCVVLFVYVSITGLLIAWAGSHGWISYRHGVR